MSIESTGKIRLNLGCGNKHWPGYINVDMPGNYSGKRPDIEADLRSLPFQNNYADEIHAIHVIEHFYQWEAQGVLEEWKRVLKPGGMLVLELPCLDKVLGHFFKAINNGGEQVRVNMTFWALYGDPSYKDPSMTHRWAYSGYMIQELAEKAGFEEAVLKDPYFHQPTRDMRLEARKPVES